MAGISPAIVERIVERLRVEGAPRSSGSLAREHLGLGLIDEAVADRLLGPLLDADPRLERTAAGWRARNPGGSADVGGAPRLRAPHLVVSAPRFAEGLHHAVRAGGSGPPEYAVALGGAEECDAFAQVSGRRLGVPCVNLATVTRRMRGYRGRSDAVRIAEVLGVPHVQGEGLEGWTAVVAAIWEHLAGELEAEGIQDLEALDRLLSARAEPASFSGKRISPAQLQDLPEQPGVYVFRDASGRALYVGQSGNLACRVTSYFSGPPRDAKDRELRQRADSLEVRPTDTGLDAWIAELRTIRRLRPPLNTRRGVTPSATADGWLLVPDPVRPGRSVVFAIRDGALAGRGVIPAAMGRRPAAIERVVRGSGRRAGAKDAATAAALAESWRRAHPGHPFLQLGIDGSLDDVSRALLARTRELSS